MHTHSHNLEFTLRICVHFQFHVKRKTVPDFNLESIHFRSAIIHLFIFSSLRLCVNNILSNALKLFFSRERIRELFPLNLWTKVGAIAFLLEVPTPYFFILQFLSRQCLMSRGLVEWNSLEVSTTFQWCVVNVQKTRGSTGRGVFKKNTDPQQTV